MMPLPSRLVLALVLLAALPAAAQTRSVYTTLERCRTTEQNPDEGWVSQRCPGTAGYALNVHEGDLRQTVDVVAPSGAVFPLELWSVVSSGFSFVGPRAEWRTVRRRPVALIVRLGASEDPEHPERTTSRLAVARVSPGGACVVAVVQPAADMNAQARRLADRAARMPCLLTP